MIGQREVAAVTNDGATHGAAVRGRGVMRFFHHHKFKKMKIEEIKAEMKRYNDIFGGNLSASEMIDGCSSLEELSQIIDAHIDFLDDCVSAAKSGLEDFRQRLGLSKYSLA